MLRIKLAVIDSDQNYLNRLNATFSSMFADKLEVYYFTDFAIAQNEINSGKHIDVLLVDSKQQADFSKIPAKCAMAYFCDSNSIGSYEGFRAVGKYQKVDIIYREILSLYSDKASENIDFKSNIDNNCEITTFLSAAGGTGVSTLAVAYAIRCARKGINVLYLNFEDLGSTDIFFNSDGTGNFNNIIFALKSQKSNLSLKIQSETERSEDNVSFFADCAIALDKSALTIDDKIKLINELIIKGSFSKIIIDTHFELNNAQMSMVNKSDRVIFVSNGTEISNLKTEKALRALQLMEQQDDKLRVISKSLLLYNNFSSRYSKQMNNEYINSIGGINRIEGLSAKSLSVKISEYNVLDKIEVNI